MPKEKMNKKNKNGKLDWVVGAAMTTGAILPTVITNVGPEHEIPEFQRDEDSIQIYDKVDEPTVISDKLPILDAQGNSLTLDYQTLSDFVQYIQTNQPDAFTAFFGPLGGVASLARGQTPAAGYSAPGTSQVESSILSQLQQIEHQAKPATSAQENLRIITGEVAESVAVAANVFHEGFENVLPREVIDEAVQAAQQQVKNNPVIQRMLGGSGITNPEVAHIAISREIERIFHGVISQKVVEYLENSYNEVNTNQLLKKLADSGLDVSKLVEDNHKTIEEIARKAEEILQNRNPQERAALIQGLEGLTSSLLNSNGINLYMQLKDKLPKITIQGDLIKKIGMITFIGISGATALFFGYATMKTLKRSKQTGVTIVSKKTLVMMLVIISLAIAATCAGAISIFFVGGL